MIENAWMNSRISISVEEKNAFLDVEPSQQALVENSSLIDLVNRDRKECGVSVLQWAHSLHL